MVPVKKRLIVFRIPYESQIGKFEGEDLEIKESNSFCENLKPYFDVMSFDVYHYFHLLSIAGWLGIGKKEIPQIHKTIFSPLLVTVGRTFEFPTKKRLNLEKKVFKDVNISICLSSAEYNQIRHGYKTSPDKILTIPLGVDSSIFYPKKNFDHFNKNRKIVVVTPNTIKPQKRQSDAINVSAYLKNKGHNIVNVFVGNITDVNYFENLETQIKKSHLTYTKSQKVPTRLELQKTKYDLIFVSGQREKEFGELMRNSDIGLFPSMDESFGLVVLNAMACGTLPICFDLDAYREFLVHKQNALAVNTKKGWKGLTTKLEELILTRENLVLLSKTAANMSSQFSWSNLMHEQLLVYSQILDKHLPHKQIQFKLNNWINLNDQ